jgi:hypothetical protein
MPKDLTVVLEDRPGTLAELGETLGNAGVNIDGICGIPAEGRAIIHILVEDATAAQSALDAAGIKVEGDDDVLVIDVTDRPGELGRIARGIANAGVNINFGYLSAKGKLILGVSDLQKARGAV